MPLSGLIGASASCPVNTQHQTLHCPLSVTPHHNYLYSSLPRHLCCSPQSCAPWCLAPGRWPVNVGWMNFQGKTKTPKFQNKLSVTGGGCGWNEKKIVLGSWDIFALDSLSFLWHFTAWPTWSKLPIFFTFFSFFFFFKSIQCFVYLYYWNPFCQGDIEGGEFHKNISFSFF